MKKASLFGVPEVPHRGLAKAKKDMYRAMGCNDTGMKGGIRPREIFGGPYLRSLNLSIGEGEDEGE